MLPINVSVRVAQGEDSTRHPGSLQSAHRRRPFLKKMRLGHTERPNQQTAWSCEDFQVRSCANRAVSAVQTCGGCWAERGIGSPVTELFCQHLPTTRVSATSWKYRRKAQEEKHYAPEEALETLFLAGYLHRHSLGAPVLPSAACQGWSL